MATAAIATRQLTKHYGAVVALEGLDLEVQPGEIFGFLGPNGSGKTTTIRLLLGLIHATRGDASIMGVPVRDVERAHRHLGYVAGDVALWPQLTGRETLDLLARVAGRLDVAYRDELCERLALDPSIRVRSYSKGNRQKIALIAAFMGRPDVLLLDEPTAGLDPLMEQQFQGIAREAAERGQTLFLSSHILDEVQDLCGRVGMLREGRLVRVATLEELRRLETAFVDIVFAQEPPPLLDVSGVTDVQPLGDVPGGVRVSLQGAPGPLLQRIAQHEVLRLRTEDPSLEQIFLTYYA